MQIFQDGDALVALFHIKTAHVFIHLDRIPDSLLELCIIELAPFQAKLRFFSEDRHISCGKCILPARRLCAGDHFDRNFDQSHRDFIQGCYIFHHVIERGQIRITAL